MRSQVEGAVDTLVALTEGAVPLSRAELVEQIQKTREEIEASRRAYTTSFNGAFGKGRSGSFDRLAAGLAGRKVYEATLHLKGLEGQLAHLDASLN